MATLYISEYASMAFAGGGPLIPIASEPALVEQTPLTLSGTSGQSAAFNAATRFIRVHTTGICSILTGTNPTATTSNKRMAADQTEYFGVTPGHKLAVITNT